MPVIRPIVEEQLTFENDAYGPDQIGVVGVEGTEYMSWPFEYSLDLALRGEADPGDFIGKTALLSLGGPKTRRRVHGIVNRFEFVHATAGRLFRYRATLVPRLWILSLRQDSRIFQEKTVPEIIREVLQDAGFAANQFRFATKRGYKPREYCVQYNESDLNFVSRLMDEEGIFYYFEHDAKDHVLVIGDHPGANKALEEAVIPYREPSGAPPTEEVVEEFRMAEEMRPGRVILNDFNFEKPSLDLKTPPEEADAFREFEVYEQPADYGEGEDGREKARIRLEELQAGRRTASGRCNTFRLAPGFRFTLEGHGREECNGEYLITGVSNSAFQPQVLEEQAGEEAGRQESRFRAIPASVPYRPRREVRKIRMPGVQTATVVGPAGEEIYTDRHGRVKVQFHWDRLGRADEKSSCWIRVAQAWAGEGWGAMFIPRIGQEVIVDFIEGDPDRPIITGRVYNAERTPPYKLPEHKTKSTIRSNTSKGGGSHNELLMEDLAGKTQVVLSSAYGHRIVEDEETQTLSLRTRDEHLVELDDKNRRITVQTTKQHRMVFDDENEIVTLQSAGAHRVELDDKGKKLSARTNGGHLFTLDDENRKAELVTSGGHSLVLDDDGEKLGFVSSQGHSITLDDGGNGIVVEDSGGNLVKLDTGGGKIVIEIASGDIELSAAGGKISLKGMDVEIEAANELKLKGGMKGELDGGAQCTVKGIQTGVEGSAVTEIKGGIVKIN